MHRSQISSSTYRGAMKLWNRSPIQNIFFMSLLFFPLIARASFIESTIGTAVVDDATATYYNPSALTLLKKPQIITLGSLANFRSDFTGQAIQSSTGFTLSGS